jgi:hypothetical protein
MVLADSHAKTAQDAEVRVAVNERPRSLNRPLVVIRQSRQLRKTQCLGQDANVADLLIIAGMATGGPAGFLCVRAILLTEVSLAADQARGGMLQDDQAEDISSKLFEGRCIGLDYHPFLRGGCAGGRVSADALDFHQTQPAGAEGRKSLMPAQVGNGDVVP